jgi:putative ABC transport system permease protein
MTAPYTPSRSLFKVAWRYLLGHPLQSLLMLLGITLGVAVAVSVDIANASSERAFELSTEAVTGRATHAISAGPAGIDEALYRELRINGPDMAMAPVISHFVTTTQTGPLPLQLLGVDPFAEAPFRAYFGSASGAIPPAEQLTPFYVVPGAILISTELADQFGLVPGDHLDLMLNGQLHQTVVVGLIEPTDALSARALENVLLADIATVQEFNRQFGRIQRIDLIIPDEDQAAILAELETMLPAGASIAPVEARSDVIEQITGAFRTNLTALSLLGLTVGIFLIYNTMTFSVIQRRKVFGTLRSLGVTGREIFTLVLVEAALIGLLGSVLGLGLGVLLGRGAVELVSQTINDAFYTLTVQEVGLPSSSLIKGAVLGLVATVLATIPPALEAAKAPPRSAMSRARIESISVRVLRLAAAAGAGMALLSALLLVTVRLNLVLSFGATFGVVIGLALLAPWLTQILMPPAARLLGGLFGPVGRLAPREVATSASRTSVAMAALMVAVAVTIGVSLMVSSFRGSVEIWLNQILSSDVYASVVGASLAEPMTAIEPQAIETARNWPGAEALYSLRNVQVDSPYGPITVAANDNPFDGEEQVYIAVQGSGTEAWQRVMAGEAVFISEPLANRLELGLGDSITLNTDQGPHDFPIAAVFSDYTSSRGNVTMWLETYRQYWNDPAVTAFSIEAAAGTDADAMVAELREALLPIQQLHIRSNQGLRSETLEVFDRTFTITGALQLITTAVAFVGVLNAMLALQLEKQRQMGILKALGMSARQLWGLILTETGLIGLVAGLLALPTGYAVALILVELINQRSFGWSLQMQLEAQPFVQALLVAVLAALLAGLYPAYRLAKRSAADAVRFD